MFPVTYICPEVITLFGALALHVEAKEFFLLPIFFLNLEGLLMSSQSVQPSEVADSDANSRSFLCLGFLPRHGLYVIPYYMIYSASWKSGGYVDSFATFGRLHGDKVAVL